MEKNKPSELGEWDAFPCYNHATEIQYHGMTRREYFAAIILNGLLSAPGNNIIHSDLIIKAVRMSDKFIEELETRKEKDDNRR